MTVKEQYWLEGTRSTLNSRRLKNWVAPEDAIVVSRLKKAGAIIVGKSNVAKDLLDYQINGDIYPEGKNPYNQAYSPGGSSGGASAALASGMVPLELGGDFGGSIRIPANFCGVYGLKPTENTIPGYGNAPKPNGSRSHVFHMAVAGPMARTPDDLELAWNIIRGPHKRDRTVPPICWNEPSGKQPSEYRIAWTDRWPGYEPGKEILNLIRNFTEQLRQNGFQVEMAAPDESLHERSLAVYKKLSLQLILQDVPVFFKPLMINSLKRGFLKGIGSVQWKLRDSFLDYSELMGQKARITEEWEGFFEDFDLLICPMGYGPAYPRSKTGTPFSLNGTAMPYLNYVWPYTACFNASGHPAMNIPLGMNDLGLPVGVQLVGPYWSEPGMLRFAKLVSGLFSGFVPPVRYQK